MGNFVPLKGFQQMPIGRYADLCPLYKEYSLKNKAFYSTIKANDGAARRCPTIYLHLPLSSTRLKNLPHQDVFLSGHVFPGNPL